MPNKTNIGWTDYTTNPIKPVIGGWGCTKISPGCDNCYAEALNLFRGNKRPFEGRWEYHLDETELKAWDKIPDGSRVFPFDMLDLFHPDIPFWMVDTVMAAMAKRPGVQWQVLTKRHKTMLWYCENRLQDPWPDNVWPGVSVENQEFAEKRVPYVLRIPAAVRFLSVEPMLGPVDLSQAIPCGEYCDRWHLDSWKRSPEHYALDSGIHWVICGAESGPNRRPFDEDWARELRDQCQAAGVRFFYKQGSALKPGLNRVLDACTWDEMPHITAQRLY